MRTLAQQERIEEIDAVVLAGLKKEPLYIMDIRKNMLNKSISQPAIFRALARLVESGQAIREDRPRAEKKPGPKRWTGYKGHGPEPTVFWRRAGK